MSGEKEGCGGLCSSVDDVLQFSVNRLAQVLEEHRNIVLRLNELVNQALATSGPERSEAVNGIRELVNALRDARSGLERASEEYVKVVRCCMRRDKYLEALISYYMYAGSRIEQEALSRASVLVPTAEDINGVRSTVETMREAIISVSSVTGGQPSHGSSSHG